MDKPNIYKKDTEIRVNFKDYVLVLDIESDKAVWSQEGAPTIEHINIIQEEL